MSALTYRMWTMSWRHWRAVDWLPAGKSDEQTCILENPPGNQMGEGSVGTFIRKAARQMVTEVTQVRDEKVWKRT